MRAWQMVGWAVVVATLGCRPDSRVSDTGYAGTWRHGNERVTSTISIVRDRDGYRFRWGLHSADGNWEVECDWQGLCKEYVDGGQSAEYGFRTWVDPSSKHLMVECKGKISRPDEADEDYIDELVVEPGGLSLSSYTLERRGTTYGKDARPLHTFQKVSDTVAFPPSGVRP